jgi:hypothetical protein
MTTQVDTVVLAGRLLSGEGSSLRKLLPGFYADLIACEGNPFEDITRLQDPSFVMKGGCVAVDDRVDASA